jgi:4-hydroxyphenylpyruvate dioxygenase-like putative hemolysin
MSSSNPDSLFNGVIQIGIVVENVAATVASYERLLNIKGWNYNEIDTAAGKGRSRRHGKPETGLKALIAWTSLGDIELELIQPIDQSSIYAEFLRDHGQGIHHVMFATADYDHCTGLLAAQGIPVLSAGELQNTRFHLFDTRQHLGLISEIADGGPLEPDAPPPNRADDN